MPSYRRHGCHHKTGSSHQTDTFGAKTTHARDGDGDGDGGDAATTRRRRGRERAPPAPPALPCTRLPPLRLDSVAQRGRLGRCLDCGRSGARVRRGDGRGATAALSVGRRRRPTPTRTGRAHRSDRRIGDNVERERAPRSLLGRLARAITQHRKVGERCRLNGGRPGSHGDPWYAAAVDGSALTRRALTAQTDMRPPRVPQIDHRCRPKICRPRIYRPRTSMAVPRSTQGGRFLANATRVNMA